MTQAISHRPFEPGTTGWTVEDLYEQPIQQSWSQGRYELVEGVLTHMAPQGFEGVEPLSRLRRFLERHLDATNQGGEFYSEVDLLLDEGRVPRPDMLFLTPQQYERQKAVELERCRPESRYHPVYVAPLLVIESVSPGHEYHDRTVKRRWYAEAGIAHYWLLSAHERSCVCLLRSGDEYIEEASGHGEQSIHSRLFNGVTVPLLDIWRR